ncbi:MAG: phage major capsid protein [Desulfamplus sp.]|nr:phage major capsid protein [Desulfamplus sp.]
MNETRDFKLGRILDEENQTVQAVVSTEFPVKRYSGFEILDHNPESIDLSRAPLPLLSAHNDDRLPIGIVDDFTVENGELRAVIRISKNKKYIWEDIKDGIIRNVSIGYVVETSTKSNKHNEYRVTRWMPYEVSLVSAPADPKAQILRKKEIIMDVNDLKKERKIKIGEMKTLAGQAEIDEEQTKEIRGLKERIETLNLQIDALETDIPEKTERKVKQHIEVHEMDAREFRATKDYERLYDKFLRVGRSALYPDEIRSLTIGSDPSMGFVVPESFETKLVKALDENNVMRSICKVIKTSSDRHIPVVTGNTTAHWMNEEDSYTASDVTVAQKTLGAHKLGVLTLASEELAHDTGFNLGSFIAEDFGRAMGDKEEDSFVNGDGVNKPSGVLLDAELGDTTASASAITAPELLDLVHSLKRPYRKRAAFLMNDSTLKMIRQLEDTTDRFIYEESLKVGEPSTLFGRPVYVSDAVPEVAGSAKVILFGDFSFYWIADRTGRYFQELRERYADTGQIGYRGNERIDGKLILPEAVKYLQMHA